MIDPIIIIEKYYPKGSEIHHIIVNHSTQVKNKALEIVRKHPEFKLDDEFIAEAAMLHDIGIFLTKAPRIQCYGEAKYIQHGYLGADLLRAEGLPKHALVCERHTGTGISLGVIQKAHLPLPQRDMQPVSLEEQVICYADKFFSKTQLGQEHTLEKIRYSLSHHGDDVVRKFNIWHALFEG